jgi:hypothetical protein
METPHTQIVNALMECKTEKELNYVTKRYMSEIMKDPGLKDMLRSTIRRISAVLTVKRIYQTN